MSGTLLVQEKKFLREEKLRVNTESSGIQEQKGDLFH